MCCRIFIVLLYERSAEWKFPQRLLVLWRAKAHVSSTVPSSRARKSTSAATRGANPPCL